MEVNAVKKFELVNSALTKGQKITLVSGGEFGGLYAVQTVFDSCKPNRHYQDCPESMIGVTILHTPKHKRKMYQTGISYNTPLVIYDGWVDIDTDSLMYETLEEHDDYTLRKSKYLSFDNRYFTDLISQYGKGIVMSV